MSEYISPAYPSPVSSGFTVYTKTDCTYSAMVKELLEEEEVQYIHCDEYMVSKDTFLAFIESKGGKDHKSFPMVFYNGEFVGGFKETLKFCKKKSM